LTHVFVNQGVIGTLIIILGLRATMTFTSFGCKMTCEDPATGKFSWKIDKHFSWGADKECPKAGPEQFGIIISSKCKTMIMISWISCDICVV